MQKTEQLTPGTFVEWSSSPISPHFGVVVGKGERGAKICLLDFPTEVNMSGDVPCVEETSAKKAFRHVRLLAEQQPTPSKATFAENIVSVNDMLRGSIQRSLFGKKKMAMIRALCGI